MAAFRNASGSPNGQGTTTTAEKLLCVHCLRNGEWRPLGDLNSLRKHQGRFHNCWRDPRTKKFCRHCSKGFDNQSHYSDHEPNCNTTAAERARWRPAPPAHDLQRRADIWAAQADGPISPELRWVPVPGEHVSDRPAEARRRWNAILRRYQGHVAQNAQATAPVTAAPAMGNAQPMPAPPQMHPQPVNNSVWPAAPSFVMTGSDYNAAIGSGPSQSFQQQQHFPHGQGPNMLQDNLGQLDEWDASAIGMPQYVPPPQDWQQQDPQTFTDDMGHFDQQQAFDAPLPMEQGYGNDIPGDTYPMPNHLRGAYGAAWGQQRQHQELQIDEQPEIMHLHHHASNSVVLGSPAHRQGFEDHSGPIAGPSGTYSRAGRRRSANEAFGSDPDRAERGYGQQRVSHLPPPASQAPGMQRSQSMASQQSPRFFPAHAHAAGSQQHQQIGPPEPGSRRAGKQPVRRAHEHSPGCVDGHAANDGRAQQRWQFASRVPEMPHAGQADSSPTRAASQRQESSATPAEAEQPWPTAAQEPETRPPASVLVGRLTRRPPADLDFDSDDPAEVDRCIAWLQHSLGIRDHTPPTPEPAQSGEQGAQAAPTASQGGGVAASSASSGSAGGTLTPGSETAAGQDPQTASWSPQGGELTPPGAIIEPMLGDLAINGFDGEDWLLLDGNSL